MGKHRKPRNNDESSSEDDDSNSICIDEEDENEATNGNGNGNGTAVDKTNNANDGHNAEVNPVEVENVANEVQSHVPDIEDTVGDHDMKLRKMEALDKTKWVDLFRELALNVKHRFPDELETKNELSDNSSSLVTNDII